MSHTNTDQSGEIKRFMDRIEAGEEGAKDDLCALVYENLICTAHRLLEKGPRGSLHTMDLVNEFFLHMIDKDRLGKLKNRRFFYGTVNDQMWRLLIDRYRKRKTKKRGGEFQKVGLDFLLDELISSVQSRSVDKLELLEAELERLKDEDQCQHEIISLRFFSGQSMKEIARVLDMSTNTVKHQWNLARAKLHSRIKRQL